MLHYPKTVYLQKFDLKMARDDGRRFVKRSVKVRFYKMTFCSNTLALAPSYNILKFMILKKNIIHDKNQLYPFGTVIAYLTRHVLTPNMNIRNRSTKWENIVILLKTKSIQQKYVSTGFILFWLKIRNVKNFLSIVKGFQLLLT